MTCKSESVKVIATPDFTPILTEQEHISAKSWLCECFPDDIDEIQELNTKQVEKAVQKYCDGGIYQFKANCTP